MGKKNEVQADSIRVCVRFRPQNSVEKRNGGKIAIQVSPDGSVARILHPKQVKNKFQNCFLFEETKKKNSPKISDSPPFESFPKRLLVEKNF